MNEDMKTINVSVKLELEDFIDFNKERAKTKIKSRVFKKSNFLRWGCLAYVALFFIVLIILLAYGLPSPSVSDNDITVVQPTNPIHLIFNNFNVVIPIAILIIVIFRFPNEIGKKSKKHFESNKRIQKQINYTFSKDGVVGVYDENNKFACSWDEIYEVVETKKTFGLFESDQTVLIIPKRVFKDEQSIMMFKELLKSCLPPKKLKLHKVH